MNPQQRLLKGSVNFKLTLSKALSWVGHARPEKSKSITPSSFCGELLPVEDLGLHKNESKLVSDTKALLLEANCSLVLDNQTLEVSVYGLRSMSRQELFKVCVGEFKI